MQVQRLLHSKKPHVQKLSEEHLQLANLDKKAQSVLQLCSIRKVRVFMIGTFELLFLFPATFEYQSKNKTYYYKWLSTQKNKKLRIKDLKKYYQVTYQCIDLYSYSQYLKYFLQQTALEQRNEKIIQHLRSKIHTRSNFSVIFHKYLD